MEEYEEYEAVVEVGETAEDEMKMFTPALKYLLGKTFFCFHFLCSFFLSPGMENFSFLTFQSNLNYTSSSVWGNLECVPEQVHVI